MLGDEAATGKREGHFPDLARGAPTPRDRRGRGPAAAHARQEEAPGQEEAPWRRPRSSPDPWPRLLANSQDGGEDCVWVLDYLLS